MKEGVKGENSGGAKRRQKINFRPPWQIHGMLKGGGLLMERWACSRTATIRERKLGWVVVILGRIQETPMWENDLVWTTKMLGQRHRSPR